MACRTTVARPGDLRVLCETHNSMWSLDMSICDARIEKVEHDRAAAHSGRQRWERRHDMTTNEDATSMPANEDTRR